MFQYFIKMDPNSTNIFEIWTSLARLTINGNKELHNTLQVS